MQVTIPRNIKKIRSRAFRNYIDKATISVTIYSKDVILGKRCFITKDNNTIKKCFRGSTADQYVSENDHARAIYIDVDSNLYFDANGGSCKIASMRVTSEYNYLNLPVPARTGYSFLGWFTQRDGGVQVKEGDLITQKTDQTVYAQWKKISVNRAKIQKLINKSRQKAVVTIQGIPEASGYEVQYSMKKNMKNAKIKKKKSPEITIKSLKKKKTYYMKARAYVVDSSGEKVYGEWSPKKKINIKK